MKKLGFGTVVYSNDKEIFKDDDFKELFFIYIESGIPTIATLSSKHSHHAVIVIGRMDVNKEFHYPKKKKKFLNYKYNSFSDVFKNILLMNQER